MNNKKNMSNLILKNFNPNWKQLRKQKLQLLELVENEDNYLYGLINLLDYIQDQAFESGNWTEKEIFGTLNDN